MPSINNPAAIGSGFKSQVVATTVGGFGVPTQPAVGTTVDSANAAYTYGAEVELLASSLNALITGLRLNFWSAAYANPVFRLSTGSAGAEVPLYEVPGFSRGTAADQAVLVTFPLPLRLEAGTRVTGAFADASTGVHPCQTTLVMVAVADVAAYDS